MMIIGLSFERLYYSYLHPFADGCTTGEKALQQCIADGCLLQTSLLSPCDILFFKLTMEALDVPILNLTEHLCPRRWLDHQWTMPQCFPLVSWVLEYAWIDWSLAVLIGS